MSLLNALRERLLGQAQMDYTGAPTQGLIGTGGRFGGGMLQKRMDQPGGLLGGQIPELALLGSALYGQGIQGKDPLEGLFPAYTQAAQIKKALTPEKERLMTAYDPKTGETVFATRTQIEERGLTPVPESPETTAAQKNFAALKKIEETGTDLEKRVARMVYGKPGREPMSKTEFLSKVTTNLSKDALADPDAIQKILPKWEQVYDDIFNVQTSSVDQNMSELPENFKGSLEQWNQLKSSNPNISDKDLIEYFNRKYGG
jgi:hypothetical protein